MESKTLADGTIVVGVYMENLPVKWADYAAFLAKQLGLPAVEIVSETIHTRIHFSEFIIKPLP